MIGGLGFGGSVAASAGVVRGMIAYNGWRHSVTYSVWLISWRSVRLAECRWALGGGYISVHINRSLLSAVGSSADVFGLEMDIFTSGVNTKR
jgi:hypothetical protein